MDEVEPAERDDAEEELSRVPRGRVVEAKLGADRGQRLLTGGEVLADRQGAPPAQSASFDQTDEVRPSGQEVEVIGDGAGKDGLRRLLARQCPGSPLPHSLPDLLVATLQYR